MVAWERQLPVFWGLKLGRVMPLLIETVYVNVKMIAGYAGERGIGAAIIITIIWADVPPASHRGVTHKAVASSFWGDRSDGGMQPKDISDVQAAVRATHGCESIYRRTEFVREAFQGGITWDGLVRVFKLINHSKAKYCYAWSYREGGAIKYAAVLGIGLVNSSESAVKAAKASKAGGEESIHG